MYWTAADLANHSECKHCSNEAQMHAKLSPTETGKRFLFLEGRLSLRLGLGLGLIPPPSVIFGKG